MAALDGARVTMPAGRVRRRVARGGLRAEDMARETRLPEAWSSTPRRWRSSKSAWFAARALRTYGPRMEDVWRVAPKRPTSYRSYDAERTRAAELDLAEEALAQAASALADARAEAAPRSPKP
ncbi:MAG: hypothetical protein ACLTMP_03570 [Eggerthella lenta]